MRESKTDELISLASMWFFWASAPLESPKCSAQTQMRSVEIQSLSVTGAAMELQVLSERREGKVTGKSLRTVVGSIIRRGIYAQQILDIRPTNRSACTEEK